MKGGSIGKLARELSFKTASPLRDQIIENAVAGKYHDFHAEHPTPKVLLVDHLRKAGFADLEKRAMYGEYDDQPCLRGTCTECDGLAATMDKFLKGQPV